LAVARVTLLNAALVREGDRADTVDDFMTTGGNDGIDPPLANIPPPRRFLLFHVANP
jgi:hypothetical protein